MDSALLEKILRSQQEQFLLVQNRLIETLTKQFQTKLTTEKKNVNSIDGIANSITEFQFNPQTKQTFESWFSRCEDIFRHGFHSQDDEWKLHYLLRKLGTKEYQRYKHSILPKTPGDFTLPETVAQLTDIFGALSSLFNTCYNCLKLKNDDNEDFFAYAGEVNLRFENFQQKSLTEDQVKCLIFIAGLQSPNDAGIRTRRLSMLEQDRDIAVKILATKYQRLIKLKRDTEMIQLEPFQSSFSTRIISMEKSPTKRKKNTNTLLVTWGLALRSFFPV